MGIFFKDELKQGLPISTKGFAAGIAAIAKALERMEIIGGHVEWFGDGGRVPRLVIHSDEGDELTADSSVENLKQKSIQENSEGVLQVFGFDEEDTTEKGLSQLISADEEGEISTKNGAEKYQLLARVETGDGYIIGYMPLGDGSGEPEEMPDDEEETKCDQNEHPADSGNFGNDTEDNYEDNDEHPAGDGDSVADSDDTDHPAASECYTTAA